MKNVREIDNELYNSIYGLPRKGNVISIWNNIKKDDELLMDAISIEKDKFGERDIVRGITICDYMLLNYQDVKQEIYQKLIDTIYSNPDVARIVLDGPSNGGYSYLLMTLWNNDLVLTEEQKKFAVNEAMNKIVTIKYQKEELFSNKLDEIGSDTQAHGVLPFDIRYYILRNSNWTVLEKAKLVYDFFEDSKNYDEVLEQWEWDIINDPANCKDNDLPRFDKCELYYYTYDQLLEIYISKEVTDKIWAEIEFCKLMHALRPQQWELKQSQIKRLGSI